jgi:hypothetical protein
VADRAYQQAVQYAHDRAQSRDLAGSSGPVSIIHHPDVKRMLLRMRAYTEGCRSLAYVAAACSDAANQSPDEATRKQNLAVYEYLVPIVKGFSTEMSVEVTALGVQVHGGMGFIEETGAAQHYRDSKILTIYEGTTAIQANDIVGRKTVRDAGATAKAICAQIANTEQDLAAHKDANCAAMLAALREGREALESVITYVVGNAKTNIKEVYAGAAGYLRLAGVVVCGWQMARAMMIALDKQAEDPAFYNAKVITARFYAENILCEAKGLASSVIHGGATINAMANDMF